MADPGYDRATMMICQQTEARDRETIAKFDKRRETARRKFAAELERITAAEEIELTKTRSVRDDRISAARTKAIARLGLAHVDIMDEEGLAR